MSQQTLLGFARGTVASCYRSYRRLGWLLVLLGALVVLILALASPGQEALLIGGFVMLTAVVPGVLLVLLGRRDVEQHPLVTAIASGQLPTSYAFSATIGGYSCRAIVIVDGIPHHFAIPRELMPR